MARADLSELRRLATVSRQENMSYWAAVVTNAADEISRLRKANRELRARLAAREGGKDG